MDQALKIIGSEEWCQIDAIGIPAIKARVDSGAKTSSIQATNITPFVKRNENWVRFEVNPLQDNLSLTLDCSAKVIDIRKIKSSSGIVEERYVILVPIRLGKDFFEIELTLSKRDNMEYRMLLGRQALQKRYLVNSDLNFCHGNYSDEKLQDFYSHLISQKSGYQIALLATDRTLYSNKRLMDAAIARGHEINFYNIQHCYMRLDTQSPEVRYRGGKLIEGIHAVIPRIRPSMTFYGCALLRQFKSIGSYCVNSAEAISQSRDKLFSSQLFNKHGIDIPITGFAKSPLDTKDMINLVGGAPLIIKLLQSAQGKGVVSAETNKAAESVINAFKSLQANILVQEFIKEAGGKDIRCLVVDGKVVASIQRQASAGEFRSNIHQGGTASKIKITPDERKMALKAAKILNLDVAGVDIIRSSRGPLLLEVNSSPGLEGVENATGIDVAKTIIMAIEKKLRKKNVSNV